MKVAITGATGGLGRSTVEALLEDGFEIIALGRNASIGAQLGCEFRAGSLSDSSYLASAFTGCSAVVHCAGLASPVGTRDDFFTANVEGTRSVLAATHLAGVSKFVHISTPSVYFHGTDRTGIRETFLPPKQSSLYGESKLRADELVIAASQRFPECSYVLLRPRAIIGLYDQTIVPRMLKLIRGGNVPLPSGGRALIDLTAAENVAHAIELSLRSDRVFHGEIFNITNEQPMRLRDLVMRLSAAAGSKPRLISIPMWILEPLAALSELFASQGREPAVSKYAIQSIGTSQVLSTEKARTLLGYRPIVSLEDALLRVAKTTRT